MFGNQCNARNDSEGKEIDGNEGNEKNWNEMKGDEKTW